MDRVALYARVSTEEQIHGLSIEVQLETLRKWAEDNHYIIVGEYVDEGVSARKPPSKRPELQRLLSDLDGIDIVAFTKLDRWTRNVKGYYAVQDKLEKANVSWTAINERYETITTNGRFLVNVMLSVSEQEADRTGDRVKVIVDHKVANGEYIGFPPPLGYSVKDKKLVPDENAKIVQGAFNEFAMTGRISAVREYLHLHGFNYTYKGCSKLLSNRMYTGEYRGNKTYCEPIITQEEYDRAQIRSVRTNNTKREYLFSGIVKCAVCGRSMSGTFHHNGYRYRCNCCAIDKMCTNNKYTSEKLIEDALFNKLSTEVSSITVEKKAKKPKDNSKKIERLTELYVDGFISKEDFVSRRQMLYNEQESSGSKVTTKKKIVIKPKDYAGLERSQKRMLWRSIISHIECHGTDVVVHFGTEVSLSSE